MYSSPESTKLATSCWPIIDRRKDTGYVPPPKRYPHPKTKEKLQQDHRRSTVTIKSNPILAGWVNHNLENDNNKVLPLLWRFWDVLLGFPAWGSSKRTRNPQGIWLKASRIWLQDFHRTGGDRDSTFVQTKSCTNQDPGERSSGPTRDWTRPIWQCWRVSCVAVG